MIDFSERADGGDSGERVVNDRELLGRVNRWAMERLLVFPPKVGEAKARKMIAADMRVDLEAGKGVNSDEINKQWKRLEQKLEGSGVNVDSPLSEVRKDSITGDQFKTVIRREQNAWVAEETRMDGSYISQAKVTDEGVTELTLHFEGERYRKMGADVYLTVDRRFPRATLTTMELLLDTF